MAARAERTKREAASYFVVHRVTGWVDVLKVEQDGCQFRRRARL